jgi:5'-3' exonuclease
MEDDRKPLVLVDSSYFSIKRATALMSWWARAVPEDPKTSNLPWVLNPVYMEKYTKLFKQNIDNLAKHFNVSPQNILFARDCPIDQIWRRKLYPGYKASRCSEQIPPPILTPTLDDEIGLGLLMDVSKMSKSWQHLDKKVIGMDMLGFGPVVKHNNDTFLKGGYVKTVRIDQAEADDVCAIIAMRVRQLQPNRKIVIVANDRDYLQLIDPNLTVVDIPSFNPITHKKGELTANEALLHKIIAGDTSDDIPSCGSNDAKKYACNPILLQKLMETDPVFKQKYEFNSVLIDFRKIPEEIQNTIWNSFLEICPGFANITKPSNLEAEAQQLEITKGLVDLEVKQQPESYQEKKEKKEMKEKIEIKIVPKRVALKIIPIARKSTQVISSSSTFSE